jgi:ADP-heptose:LPS heptosyltransferase
VSDRPPTHLAVTEAAAAAIAPRLQNAGLEGVPFVALHPAAAFATKQWSAEKFGQVAQGLSELGLPVVVITTPSQGETVEALKRHTSAPVVSLSDLSLPEITALLARARLFVGNDSGIAHMAAAVETPAVVIFGSSNTAHWRPWVSDAPGAAAEVVFEEMDCQPCHGYFCEKFAQPECILRVPVNRVMAAIERVLRESAM